MQRFVVSLLVLFCVTIAGGAARAETRVALVIGNSSYAVAPLTNPKNDAALMSRTLKAVGFDVLTVIDGSQMDMKRAIQAFGGKLDAAGKDGVGVFFYAGHGVQVGGTNYLIPVDARIQREGDVDLYAVNANAVLRQMEFSGVRLSFVILDACRVNPFSRGFRSGSRGLAKMEAATGALVAYATAPGDVAADGRGANSPYTAALAKMIQKPGLAVERMFREVRNEVRKATNNEQTPWESSSLVGGDFYFTPSSQGEPPVPADAPSVNPDIVFWESIESSDTPEVFQEYLKRFPNGQFASQARRRLQSLAPTEPIMIRARDFQHSRNVEVGVLPYGADVVHNAAPYGLQENMVEYVFQAPRSGNYELFVEYAAMDSRPVAISLNGEIINASALQATTGGWESQYQMWLPQGVVHLRRGKNTLRISRSSYFPHIRGIKFVPQAH